MTSTDITDHNRLCAELTAEDGIPRLTWEQHGAAFSQPVTKHQPGAQVAAYDSATPGTVVTIHDGDMRYGVTYPDMPGHTPLSYSASQLRPWPLDVLPAQVRP